MKILIIEDNWEDYELLRKILSRYDLEIFPNGRPQYNEFQRALIRMATNKADQDIRYIDAAVTDFKPDCVFLDMGLIPNSDNDITGKIIRKDIIDKKLPDTKVCILTAYTEDNVRFFDKDHYIYKDWAEGSEYWIEEYLVEQLGLVKPTIWNAVNQPGSKNLNGDIPLTALKKFAIKAKNLLDWTKSLVAVLITFIFYFALFVTAILGIAYLVFHILTDGSPVQIAEHTFIVFLPFLIVFGFYVFYLKALERFIVRQKELITNYDTSSNLMKVTKQLFISSLISYLFINVIELLVEEKDSSIIKFQKGAGPAKLIAHDSTLTRPVLYESGPVLNYLHSHNPLMQVYLLGGCIIVLILFYIFLINHKESVEPAVAKAGETSS